MIVEGRCFSKHLIRKATQDQTHMDASHQLKYHTCDPLQTQLEVFKLGAKIRQLSMIIRHV